MNGFRYSLTIVAVLSLGAAGTGHAGTFYGASTNNELIAIDTATGTGHVIGAFGTGGVYAGAFNPAGTFYTVLGTYTPTSYLATVNLTTGQATNVAQLASTRIDMLQFTPSGALYASDGTSLYDLNPLTGALTTIGSFGSGINMMMDLALDSHGTLYGVASDPASGGTSDFYSINPANGAATLLFQSSIPCIMSLAFDSADHLYASDFCHANSPWYEVNLGASSVTQLALTGLPSVHGGDIAPAPTPEPACWALLAGGLLAIFRRRQVSR